MTPDTSFTYPLIIGMALGGSIASLVWWAAYVDLRKKKNWIIDRKESALKNKKPKITVHCYPDGFVRFE